MLEFSLASSADAVVLMQISKHAFDSDVEVGAVSAGGPPGYDSLEFYTQMASGKNLYKLTADGAIVGGAVLFKDGDKLNVGASLLLPNIFAKGTGSSLCSRLKSCFLM